MKSADAFCVSPRNDWSGKRGEDRPLSNSYTSLRAIESANHQKDAFLTAIPQSDLVRLVGLGTHTLGNVEGIPRGPTVAGTKSWHKILCKHMFPCCLRCIYT